MDEFAATMAAADPFQSWMPIVVAVVVGVAMAIHSYMGGLPCPSTNDIPDKVVIVTGGNGGIGYEICRELCTRKAIVVMASRDMNKGKAAILKIKQNCPLAKIEVLQLDLASFGSVRTFASKVLEKYPIIHALVNNAGVFFHSAEPTVDGFEPHLQVNYLSAILLTELLRDSLQTGEPGRVVFTAAHAYVTATVDPLNPLNVGETAKVLHPRDWFALTKALLVMWTHLMGKVVNKSKMRVFAYSPGFVRETNHLKNSPLMKAVFGRQFTYPLRWLFMKSPDQGAQTAIYLVTDPTLRSRSGEYFNDCTPNEIVAFAADEQLATTAYEETSRIFRVPASPIQNK